MSSGVVILIAIVVPEIMPLSGSATSAPTPSGDDGGWQSAGASLWVYVPGNHGTEVGR